MLRAFAATYRQLAEDHLRRQALFLGIPLLLALAWMAWMFLAHVTLEAATERARIEVAQAVYSVQAPVSGRVTQSYLEPGRQVEAGAVLVELEADPQRLRVQHEATNQEILQSQLLDLRSQLSAQQHALSAEHAAGAAEIEQSRASLAEAEETLRLQQDQLQKSAAMYKAGIIPETDFRRVVSEFKKKQIELRSSQVAVRRTQREQLMRKGEREARLQGINGDIARIEGELATSDNAMQQLEHELGWHRIIAPSRGRLDEVVNIKSGSYVQQGDRLATVVPDGQLRIVAYFEPRVAIGRVRPGQTGHFRLDGFPWAEYGSVETSVTSVGSEVHDGRVRVELDPHRNGRLRLQHGLTGTLDVELERISPASYLLRKAGIYLTHPESSQVASR